jgi:hypothetical protein
MNRYSVGLVISAVLVCVALGATSAFALEWLVEAATFAGDLPAETVGLLNLITLNSTGGILQEIDCNGTFDGSIEQPNLDTIDKVLNTLEEEVSTTPLVGLALECEVTFHEGALTDCAAGTIALVWAVHLPWATETVLMEPSGEILDLLLSSGAGEPGYEVECTTLSGLKASDECTGATSSKVSAEAGTTPPSVLGTFNFEAPISSELGSCAVSGANVAALKGEGNIWAVGGTLAAPEWLNRLATSIDHV